MPDTVLVIQCFIKFDTLQGLCESLIRCDGISELNVLFWSDSPIGSRNETRFRPMFDKIQDFISDFTAKNGQKFKSIESRGNEINLGTCKTCETAMNYAFQKFPFAILVEDDVIFSRDAFIWFERIRQQGLLSEDKAWAIAGESIFFNARDKPLPPGWADKMRQLAQAETLNSFYVTHKFIPSTCFATTAAKWREFGSTRGGPIGDVDVCNRCIAEERYGIFPVVPRVKDVGMLHDDGYSVMIHTKAGVTEIKNTYLMSDELSSENCEYEDSFSLYSGSEGRIYSITTLLIE